MGNKLSKSELGLVNTITDLASDFSMEFIEALQISLALVKVEKKKSNKHIIQTGTEHTMENKMEYLAYFKPPMLYLEDPVNSLLLKFSKLISKIIEKPLDTGDYDLQLFPYPSSTAKFRVAYEEFIPLVAKLFGVKVIWWEALDSKNKPYKTFKVAGNRESVSMFIRIVQYIIRVFELHRRHIQFRKISFQGPQLAAYINQEISHEIIKFSIGLAQIILNSEWEPDPSDQAPLETFVKIHVKLDYKNYPVKGEAPYNHAISKKFHHKRTAN